MFDKQMLLTNSFLNCTEDPECSHNMDTSAAKVVNEIQENLLASLTGKSSKERKGVNDYINQMYSDLKNYDVDTFFKYYELYYTSILVAKYWDLERQILQYEANLMQKYIARINEGKMERDEESDCLKSQRLDECYDKFYEVSSYQVK